MVWLLVLGCYLLLSYYHRDILAGEIVFLKESFEDSNFKARGWYDNTKLHISDKEHIPGSSSSLEFHFKKGAKTPSSGWAMRRKFPETETLYVSYYVKYSMNWEGSNKRVHPHEFHILTNLDKDYAGPAYAFLCVYIEQNEGEPVFGIQDSKNINKTGIGRDLTHITEDRSVAGCNGDGDGHGTGTCYRTGGIYRNWKSWRAGKRYFTDVPGPHYKNDWHFIEVYFQLNTISNGKSNNDGKIRYWYDGKLVFEYNDVLFRTAKHANMKLNQFLIGPYIGEGSPVDQTFWIDNLMIGSSRVSKTIVE